MAATLPQTNDMDNVDMEKQQIPIATTRSLPTNDNNTVAMKEQQISVATIPSPPTNENNTLDTEDQQIPTATTPSQSSTEQFFTPTSTPPPSPTNWDTIDPTTGLSKDYMTALAIIDSCNGAELRRFNAPLLANHSITVRQQIEMYYSGGESAEHRRKRTAGKRASVLDRVAAVLAAWKNGRGAKG